MNTELATSIETNKHENTKNLNKFTCTQGNVICGQQIMLYTVYITEVNLQKSSFIDLQWHIKTLANWLSPKVYIVKIIRESNIMYRSCFTYKLTKIRIYLHENNLDATYKQPGYPKNLRSIKSI